MPAKAIPPARDRLQSQLLVCIVILFLCYTGRGTVWWMATYLHLTRTYLSETSAAGVIFALGAWRFRAATKGAALVGGVICVLIILFTSLPKNVTPFHSGLVPLILLFVLTFEATRLGRRRKVATDVEEIRRARNTAQIVANLGVAGLCSSLWTVPAFDISGDEGWVNLVGVIAVPVLAALAEATADTVSSEIGQASGGTPFMLTTLRRVPPGTDGAVTLIGTLAGITAASIVVASGIPVLGMTLPECGIALGAGVAGLFFDSLLGATLERRGWIGNDLVNFASTAFAAAVALLAIRFGQDHLLR